MWAFSVFLLLVTNSEIVRADEEVSFKNLELAWSSNGVNRVTESVNVTSSNNLKETIPDTLDGELSVKVNGEVPILYENAITDLKNLSVLGFGKINLQEIKPGAFKQLQVSLLFLSGNKLKELRKGVFEDVSVATLQMFDNELRRIEPGTFRAVRNLKSFSLSRNKFEQIDPEAFDIPSLEYLDMEFNSISALKPGDLRNLPNLRTLHLTANKLKIIPEGVFNNLKLTQLKLNYNEIGEIATKAFDDMSALSVLHIDHNKLTRWDNGWLHNCPKISYVIAGFNQIEEIPKEAFKNYPRVYSIDLQNNKIKRISSKALVGSKSIVNFNLRDNEIDFWDENVLGNVTISTVFLEDNKLKCIDGDLKRVFKTVYSAVHLHGNPWDPECQTKSDYLDRPGSPPKLEDL